MVTTEPGLAPFGTGEVVILVPRSKFFELLTSPVMEPSGFCFHRDSMGMLVGSCLGVVTEPPPPPKKEKAGLVGALEGLFLAAGATLSDPLPAPNNEMVPPRFGTLGSGFFDAVFGTAPKMFKVPGRLGISISLGSGGFPKRLTVPTRSGICGRPRGAGAGAGDPPPKKEKGDGAGAFFWAGVGADLAGAGAGAVAPKIPKIPASLFGLAAGAAGAGAGAGAFLGAAAGALPKKEKAGLGAGAGAGLGAATGLAAVALGAGLEPTPNNEEKASVTGSDKSIWGAGAGSGLGAAVRLGAAAGWGAANNDSKTFLAGAALAFRFGAATGCGFGAGAGAEGEGMRSLSADKSKTGFFAVAGAGLGVNTLDRSNSKRAGGAAGFCSAFFGAMNEPNTDDGLFLGGAGAFKAASFRCFSSHSRACFRAKSAAC